MLESTLRRGLQWKHSRFRFAQSIQGGVAINARLLETVPEPRLRRYKTLADAQHVDLATFYRWSSQVALVIWDDLSVIEVAMRGAMAHELQSTFGFKWFENPGLFDDDTTRQIQQALNQSNRGVRPKTDTEVHGKLVAELTFGFWVKLLGKGSFQNVKDPNTGFTTSTKRIYDQLLWRPALSKAFPEVGLYERRKVEKVAHDLQLVRNRVAHHEHVIWGIPAYGQKEADGHTHRRLSLHQVYSSAITLAGYMNPNLASWIVDNTSIKNVLSKCPLKDSSSLKL